MSRVNHLSSLSLLAVLVLAGCSSQAPQPLKKGEKAIDVASVVRQKMPASVKDRDAWAKDLATTFESQGLAPTLENVCSVLAVAQQESNYQADPAVPGLSKIAWQEIDRRYLEAHRLSGRPDIVNRLNNSTTLLDAAVYLHQECGIEKSPEGICEEFETLLGDFYRYELKLMDGALEALTKLKEKEFSLALATASSSELAHAALRRNGAENFFDHFFCNADKMETTTFYNAIEALGTGIGETVVFDDLPKIQAKASSLGFRVYGALNELE